jgi:ABC-2 type transport system ATP-binding protein
MGARGAVGNGQWVIETEQLTKRFGSTAAVQDMHLKVARGTLFGLIGPNGAGKTTTLRLLAGLITPDKGHIRLDGRSLDGDGADGAIRRSVGYMPDFFGVYEDMRSWEYLDFYARCYGIREPRRSQVVGELLDLVDLTEKRDADVHTLSRGMKQRLCLAHALVHDPRVLLLDEPASGLDPRARLEMRALLQELRSMGKTIVISSHVLAELGEMCDSVGIMERGRLLVCGSLDEIERQLRPGQTVRVQVASPLSVARAVLTATPGVQVLAANEDGEDDGGWLEFTADGDEEVRASVLATLVAAGVRVTAYLPREHDLEGLFMSITKGALS